MAPRRKVGMKRRDAAIDAMLTLGFSRRLITQTIKELLRVYGGNDGWRFIEMDSYRALIEAILDKDDGEVASTQIDDQGGEASHKLSEAGSSSVHPAPVDRDIASQLSSPVDDILDSSSHTETVLNPSLIIPESVVAECNPMLSPAEEHKDDAVEEAADKGTPHSKLPLSGSNSPNTPCFTAQQPPLVSGKRRRPYYGMVRDDDKEYDESDFLEFEPFPMPEEILKIIGKDIGRPSKRSRWDVKP